MYAVISSTRITGNQATLSGGAFWLPSSSLEIVDSEVSANTAPTAAAFDQSFGAGLVTLTNTTIAGNTSATGGTTWNGGTMTIRNSILWGNQPTDFAPAVTPGGLNVLTIQSSNVSGEYPSLIAFDPEFVAAPADLRLSAGSPCIDTGDDTNASQTDILDHPRVDVPSIPTCTPDASPCGSLVDMGAYEFGY